MKFGVFAACLVLCALAFIDTRAAVAGTLPTTIAFSITPSSSPTSSLPANTVVTLTAQVTSGVTSLSIGQVAFCDSSTVACVDVHRIGLAQLTPSGVATMKFVPGPGAHSYTARFLGTKIYAGSTSPSASVSVLNPSGPTTTRVGILASGGQGAYNLLGTVATNGAATPTGQVSFQDTDNSNYVLGTGTLGPTGSTGITFYQSTSVPLPADGGDGALSSAAIGDFNGDGHPDFVVSTNFSPTVVVALGNGDGTFRTSNIPFQAINGSFSPGTLVTGDFNSDGKTDFVMLNGGGYQVFLGNGDGTFVALPTAAVGQVGGGYLELIAADVDGDGQVDLITDSFTGGNVAVFHGNGNGTFNLPTSTILTHGVVLPSALVVGDFNGDGIPDLAFGDTDNLPSASTLNIALGNGDGTFQAPVVVASGSRFFGVAAADLNNDGKLDLIAVNPNATPSTVLLGNGDGTFRTLPGNPAMGLNSASVAVGDFNGDGIPDVVMPDANGGNTTVFLGNGDGTFVADAFSPSVVGYNSFSLALADFDGNGQTDILNPVFDDSGNPTIHDQASVLLAQAPSTAAVYVNDISPVGTGDHYVLANYSGDSNSRPGLSGTIPLAALQVTTNLALSVNPAAGSTSGQSVTLTATLDRFFAQNHYAAVL